MNLPSTHLKARIQLLEKEGTSALENNTLDAALDKFKEVLGLLDALSLKDHDKEVSFLIAHGNLACTYCAQGEEGLAFEHLHRALTPLLDNHWEYFWKEGYALRLNPHLGPLHQYEAFHDAFVSDVASEYHPEICRELSDIRRKMRSREASQIEESWAEIDHALSSEFNETQVHIPNDASIALIPLLDLKISDAAFLQAVKTR